MIIRCIKYQPFTKNNFSKVLNQVHTTWIKRMRQSYKRVWFPETISKYARGMSVFGRASKKISHFVLRRINVVFASKIMAYWFEKTDGSPRFGLICESNAHRVNSWMSQLTCEDDSCIRFASCRRIFKKKKKERIPI